jgi:hypothetical protein
MVEETLNRQEEGKVTIWWFIWLPRICGLVGMWSATSADLWVVSFDPDSH